ncbi:unnamed protein product [Closterium sp. Yama58-4]|nr:unnamed protein product [Closterium sp. Yama58-4]
MWTQVLSLPHDAKFQNLGHGSNSRDDIYDFLLTSCSEFFDKSAKTAPPQLPFEVASESDDDSRSSESVESIEDSDGEASGREDETSASDATAKEDASVDEEAAKDGGADAKSEEVGQCEVNRVDEARDTEMLADVSQKEVGREEDTGVAGQDDSPRVRGDRAKDGHQTPERVVDHPLHRVECGAGKTATAQGVVNPRAAPTLDGEGGRGHQQSAETAAHRGGERGGGTSKADSKPVQLGKEPGRKPGGSAHNMALHDDRGKRADGASCNGAEHTVGQMAREESVPIPERVSERKSAYTEATSARIVTAVTSTRVDGGPMGDPGTASGLPEANETRRACPKGLENQGVKGGVEHSAGGVHVTAEHVVHSAGGGKDMHRRQAPGNHDWDVGSRRSEGHKRTADDKSHSMPESARNVQGGKGASRGKMEHVRPPYQEQHRILVTTRSVVRRETFQIRRVLEQSIKAALESAISGLHTAAEGITANIARTVEERVEAVLARAGFQKGPQQHSTEAGKVTAQHNGGDAGADLGAQLTAETGDVGVFSGATTEVKRGAPNTADSKIAMDTSNANPAGKRRPRRHKRGEHKGMLRAQCERRAEQPEHDSNRCNKRKVSEVAEQVGHTAGGGGEERVQDEAKDKRAERLAVLKKYDEERKRLEAEEERERKEYERQKLEREAARKACDEQLASLQAPAEAGIVEGECAAGGRAVLSAPHEATCAGVVEGGVDDEAATGASGKRRRVDEAGPHAGVVGDARERLGIEVRSSQGLADGPRPDHPSRHEDIAVTELEKTGVKLKTPEDQNQSAADILGKRSGLRLPFRATGYSKRMSGGVLKWTSEQTVGGKKRSLGQHNHVWERNLTVAICWKVYFPDVDLVAYGMNPLRFELWDEDLLFTINMPTGVWSVINELHLDKPACFQVVREETNERIKEGDTYKIALCAGVSRAALLKDLGGVAGEEGHSVLEHAVGLSATMSVMWDVSTRAAETQWMTDALTAGLATHSDRKMAARAAGVACASVEAIRAVNGRVLDKESWVPVLAGALLEKQPPANRDAATRRMTRVVARAITYWCHCCLASRGLQEQHGVGIGIVMAKRGARETAGAAGDENA